MPNILIVGEYWNEDDEEKRRSFSGAAGGILSGLLSQSGIELAAHSRTVVFPVRPPSGRFDGWLTKDRALAIPGYGPFTRGNYVPAHLAPHIAAFWRTVETAKPNVILALGNVALWALTGRTGIDKQRGSPTLSKSGDYKVICTWAPSSIIKQWELRPIVFMDFCKAKAESESPRLARPSRTIRLSPSLPDIEDFYERHIVPAPFLAVDIETKSGQITEIGFATSPKAALVIPFWDRKRGSYWPTLTDELAAWEWVRRILREKDTVGQNYQYDMQYLYAKYGIPSPRFVGDTMLLSHALQPELKKSLGFLGSIYTNEPSWKFMRTDHTTLKQGDD